MQISANVDAFLQTPKQKCDFFSISFEFLEWDCKKCDFLTIGLFVVLIWRMKGISIVQTRWYT